MRLADRVCVQILDLIIARDLREGDRMPSEHRLSELTGVSRTIVREALVRLQADGLIQARHGAGSFVRRRPTGHRFAPTGMQALLDSFEVRIAAEPVAARLAAQHRTEAELQAIRSATCDPAAMLGVVESSGDLTFGFHRAIAVASHNPMFLLTLDLLAAQGEAIVRGPAADASDNIRRIEFEHFTIVEAISRGEAEVAEAAMRLHLLCARDRAIAWQIVAG